MPRLRTTCDVKPGQRSALPAGTPPWITPELVSHTLEVWGPRYRTPLTPEDAVAILISVARLLATLATPAREAGHD